MADRPGPGHRTAAWRWANVPLPEPNLVGLGAGFLLQRLAPLTPSWPVSVGRALGLPLVLAGLWLAADAAWPLLLLPVVLLATHIQVVREERALERRFGVAYRGYAASVRRYL